MLNTVVQCKLESDQYDCDDELAYTAQAGESTDANVSSETVRNRENGAGQRINLQSPHDLSVPKDNNGHDGKLFHCSKRGFCFTKANDPMRHKDTNFSERKRCLDRKPFEDLLALKKHSATHHLSLADVNHSRVERRKPPQYICSHCGRLFKTMTTLNSHVMTHTGERPCVCRIAGCGKSFTQHSTRAFHERTHSDEMPHICAVCGRRFKHAMNVRLHMSVHTGVKPHRCPSCPMLFRRTCDLQRHSLRHSSERPFKCSDCGKGFKTKKTLSRHVLSLHSDEIPWRCSVCNKGFKTASNLRVHMRVHTGDRPYVCAVCGIRFSYSSSLKSHVQVHSVAV